MSTQSQSFTVDDNKVGDSTEFTTQEDENQEAGRAFFNVHQLLENLVLLGMNTVNNWDTVVSKLKSNVEVMSCPNLLNIYFVLRILFTALSNYTQNKPESQHKIIMLNETEMSYDEILNIVNPTLKKKNIKDKTFSIDSIQKIMLLVRLTLCEPLPDESTSSCKKTTKKEQSRKRSRHNKDESSSDSSDSSSSSELESDKDEFENLFKISSKKKQKKVPVFIKQSLQYQKNNKRYKLTTPGEQGSYLIKIEITDCKDLRKCKSEKQFWTKVSKKGYFLVGSSKDELLKKVNDILVTVGNRFEEIDNVSTEISKIERSGAYFSKNN